MTRDERAFEARRRALDAIASMRNDRRSLRAAAAEAGTTPATVRRYASAALRREGRTYTVTKADRIARPMSVFTADGVKVLTVRGSGKAAEVSRHWHAIQRYLADGNTDDLARFANKRVAGVALGTNPNDIETYGRTGELALDDIYALPT